VFEISEFPADSVDSDAVAVVGEAIGRKPAAV
jgi:hypothetical protein